jgi:hypothetical protein
MRPGYYSNVKKKSRENKEHINNMKEHFDKIIANTKLNLREKKSQVYGYNCSFLDEKLKEEYLNAWWEEYSNELWGVNDEC